MSGRPFRLLSALILMLAPASALAQAPSEVGIVTTLQGQATVSRPAAPSTLPLKFKDSIFERDRINTGEKSIVKVLMGGKAIVTIRELSVLTITEDLGKTTINPDSGKIAVAVARQRMKPGERLEVHTPNAVAAVRGTVFVVEVKRQGAQQGGGNLGANTQVTSVSGTVETWSTANPANAALVNAFQSIGITAGNLGNLGNLSQQQMDALLADFAADPQLGFDEDTWAGLTLQEQNKLVALAAFLLPLQNPPQQQSNNPGGCGGTPCSTGGSPPPPPPSPGPKQTTEKITNGGFETGLFAPGWILGGGGSVISQLGNPNKPKSGFTAPEGQFMAFLYSGPGTLPGSQDTTGRFTQFSTLSQSFQVQANTLYTVKATYNFISNEYPYWVHVVYHEQSPFNDVFDIRLKSPAGQATTVKNVDVNTAFNPNNVSKQAIAVGNFTAPVDNIVAPHGWGYTDFQTVTYSFMPTASGTETLTFEVGDVLDSVYPSAVMIDAVSVTEDPPIYVVAPGARLTRTGRDPLVEYKGGSQTFDSLIAVGDRAELAGPLLRSTDTDLTVPFSLVTVLPGGSLTSTTTDPLVSLTGGTHALGMTTGLFDLAGSGTALDLETGLNLATDTPLSTGGVLFQADGAAVSTQQAVRVDTALLEATAPLIALLNGSALTTVADAIDLANHSKVTGAGSLVSLDASRMTVSNGALVNVAGGSLLRVAGNLVSLSSGSVLSILNGPLLSVSGGSTVNISGALVAFGGAGGSILSVSNSLCGGACVMIGGIPVAFSAGATAANVSIGAGAIANPNLGSVKLASPSTALVSVSGATSKVTIGAK